MKYTAKMCKFTSFTPFAHTMYAGSAFSTFVASAKKTVLFAVVTDCWSLMTKQLIFNDETMYLPQTSNFRLIHHKRD